MNTLYVNENGDYGGSRFMDHMRGHQLFFHQPSGVSAHYEQYPLFCNEVTLLQNKKKTACFSLALKINRKQERRRTFSSVELNFEQNRSSGDTCTEREQRG